MKKKKTFFSSFFTFSLAIFEEKTQILFLSLSLSAGESVRLLSFFEWGVEWEWCVDRERENEAARTVLPAARTQSKTLSREIVESDVTLTWRGKTPFSGQNASEFRGPNITFVLRVLPRHTSSHFFILRCFLFFPTFYLCFNHEL